MRSGAPFFGEYQPDGAAPVRDYHTFITIYVNPIEASDQFFQELKDILRKAPLIAYAAKSKGIAASKSNDHA